MEDLTSERHNCLRYSCAEGCGIFQRGKFSAVLIWIETNRFMPDNVQGKRLQIY